MTDKKRALEYKVSKLLDMFPVVAIIGPRQAGKSTLAKRVSQDWSYYDLERPDDYKLITDDPLGFFRRNSDKVIIDEAQQYPDLFEVLRGVIDEDRAKCGRFILTGSSSPKIVKGLSESLAGRIATVELLPFKASEFYEVELSPFYNLLIDSDTDINKFKGLSSQLTLSEVYDHCFYGGYPEPRIKGEAFSAIWQDQYFHNYINRDVSSLFPKINSHIFRRFIETLSFHSGKSINNSEIARALETSSVTVKEYLGIIHNTFLWRNLYSYEKNALKKVQKMPKGLFRDSGVLNHILKISSVDQLLIHPQAGFIFESFVIEEIIRGLDALMTPGTDFYFYRTKDKSEIDLIIDAPYGLIPIEIKLGRKVDKKMFSALSTFIKDTGCPFGILINSADRVELVADNIVQIPVGAI